LQIDEYMMRYFLSILFLLSSYAQVVSQSTEVWGFDNANYNTIYRINDLDEFNEVHRSVFGRINSTASSELINHNRKYLLAAGGTYLKFDIREDEVSLDRFDLDDNRNLVSLSKTTGGRFFGIDIQYDQLIEFFPDQDSIDVLYTFSSGQFLYSASGNVVQASNGNLYGYCLRGNSGRGGIFSFDPSNDSIQFLNYLPPQNIFISPNAGFTIGVNGKLYGGVGALIEIDPTTNQVAEISSSFPYLEQRMISARDGNIYLAEKSIYRFNPTSQQLSQLNISAFNSFSYDYTRLSQLNDSVLIGIASKPNAVSPDDIIFSYNLLNDSVEVLYQINSYEPGFQIETAPLVLNDSTILLITEEGGKTPTGLGTIMKYNLIQDTVEVIINLGYADKGIGNAGMASASNGLIYGVMNNQGPNFHGNIYSIDPKNDKFNLDYAFSFPDFRRNIVGKPVEAENGNLMLSTAFDIDTAGFIIEYNPASKQIIKQKVIDRTPVTSLTKGKNDWYYGIGYTTSLNPQHSIYAYNPLSDSFRIVIDFPSRDYLPTQANLVFDGERTLYGASNNGPMYSFDILSEQLKLIKDLRSDFTGAAGNIILSDSNLFFVTTPYTIQGEDRLNLYKLDLRDNSLIPVFDSSEALLVPGIANDMNGNIMAIVNDPNSREPSLYRIDPLSLSYSKVFNFNEYGYGYLPWGLFNIDVCYKADDPIIKVDTIKACIGDQVEFEIADSIELFDAESWFVFSSDLTTIIDSSKTNRISFRNPISGWYYVRAEGGCPTPSQWDSVYVKVSSDTASIRTESIELCYGNDFIANGLSLFNLRKDTLVTASLSANNSCDSLIDYLISIPSLPLLSDSSGTLISSIRSADQFQWYDCIDKLLIPGETSYSYTPQDSGVFAVIVQRGLCTDTSECYSTFSVGLTESSFVGQIKIYPNPSNGMVFIDREGSYSLDYQIFNIQGKLMKRGRLAADQNQFELPEAEGLYFVSFKDTEGNEKTYKLIKQ
jgi:hypothetical protein